MNVQARQAEHDQVDEKVPIDYVVVPEDLARLPRPRTPLRIHLNGAVVLFAHPYRTLWPLWSSALDLLGIRTPR